MRQLLEKEINRSLSQLQKLQRGSDEANELEAISPMLAELYLSCSFEGDTAAYQRAKDLALHYLRNAKQLQTAVELAKRHGAWGHLAQVYLSSLSPYSCSATSHEPLALIQCLLVGKLQ